MNPTAISVMTWIVARRCGNTEQLRESDSNELASVGACGVSLQTFCNSTALENQKLQAEFLAKSIENNVQWKTIAELEAKLSAAENNSETLKSLAREISKSIESQLNGTCTTDKIEELLNEKEKKLMAIQQNSQQLVLCRKKTESCVSWPYPLNNPAP